MGLIVDIIIITISIVAIIIGVLRSMKRGLFSTLVHVAGIATAAVIAAVSTGILVPYLNKILVPVIKPLITGQVAEFVYGNETLSAVVSQAPGALFAPLVFVLIFFIFKITFDIVIACVIKGERRGLISFKGDKAVSAVVGLILTVACLWIFMMPVAGTLRVAGTVVSWGVENMDKITEGKELPQYAKAAIGFASTLGDSKLVKFYDKTLGTGLLFNEMASVEVKGKRMSLPAEVEALTAIADTVLKFSSNGKNGENADFSPKEVSAALRDLSAQLGDAQITSSAVKEEVDAAVAKWKVGEEYMGIKLKTGEERIDELFDDLLKCMENSDEEAVSDVLLFVADVAEIIPEGGSEQGGKEPVDVYEGYSDDDFPPGFKESYPEGLKPEDLPEGMNESDFPEGFFEKVNENEKNKNKDDAKGLLAGIDVESAVGLIGKAFDNDTMKPFSEALIKWILRRAAEAVEVNADEEIDRISLSESSSEDVKELQDLLAGMVNTAIKFQEKLTNDEKLTKEEQDILVDAVGKLQENKIIGAAVKKIYDGAKQKPGIDLPD